jgi:hypothetical protein
MTPTAFPWHSLVQNVHHTHNACADAKRVDALVGARREGTGSRPLCPECAQLIVQTNLGDAGAKPAPGST